MDPKKYGRFLLGKAAFSLLARQIRSALADLGFSEPTEPQKKAIPPILRGENVLLIAPTGSGKTEAALLPVFSNLLSSSKEEEISVLYITPLRALNRDMLRRVSEWSNWLGFSVEVRHGDTTVKIRRRQAVKPPDMLITTPETLQAILPGRLMRRNLGNVRFVIIDEVHEIAESKRGVQLAVALERLREVTEKEFQRIGLSATIGSPEKAAGLIGGANRPVRIVQAFPTKRYEYSIEYPFPNSEDYDLAADLLTSPEAAARIRRILDLIKSHVSTLVFVNSRTNAEMLGHKLGSVSKEIAVHHGSLSKEERHTIEDEFKEGLLKALICTSTLELGIDIGNVDFTIQYLSPRQVSALIQRVGRSGHRLDTASKGVIITAFPDDLLEAMATVRRAYKNLVEPTRIHENALDVLAHQIAGILMDKRRISIDEAFSIVKRAYPYRNLSREKMLEVVKYLNELRLLWMDGEILGRNKRTRRYYYENLSIIPDERRYPVIDIISDRKIGTVGEEFMALRARIGLNFLCKGKVWRIVQVEDETGRVYVIPSEDPLAAAPGWDGEMISIPQAVAEEVGKIRHEIAEEIRRLGDIDAVAEKIVREYHVDPKVLHEAVGEIYEHFKRKLPVPTDRLILIEGYGKYLIVHLCFGEIVNVTLGCIFDAVLSDRELITGWWNDGYRILIEMPRKIEKNELERLPSILFNLSDEEVDKAFNEYLKSRFPFAERLKFIAERFGALPRGRLASPRLLSQILGRFKKTPVFEETLREVMTERIDLEAVKRMMASIRSGQIQVKTLLSKEKPSPIAYHILEKYADIPELMAPRRIIISNIERMKRSIESRKVRLLCLSCGDWLGESRILSLPERPACGKCGLGLLAVLRRRENADRLREMLRRRLRGEELNEEELKELSIARRTADLVLSYGKRAIVALQVKGVGPETAFRILGKMHFDEKEFYLDLLKAKIRFLRTRQYWDEKTPVAP
ncbi:DEAD/DEAH box helicase [Candidatus Bathyarchaeota archaeon]|nr:MAG: DEAD/DEAH box helicase [Candidatus Bathyarchaeota archaeon]